jgi:hypothetical protein
MPERLQYVEIASLCDESYANRDPSEERAMAFETSQRPRWGTFSVVDHNDLAPLVVDLLLYDRLVFPAPVLQSNRDLWNDGDRARFQEWSDRGWRPDVLLRRVQEMNGLAHLVLWEGSIRDQWSSRWERLKRAGRAVEGAAQSQTAYVLSASIYGDPDLVPPPVPIAAYRSERDAVQDTAMDRALSTKEGLGAPPDAGVEDPSTEQTASRKGRELHRAVAALFGRMLRVPAVETPERAYAEAIELSGNEKYRRARRALYDWEDERVAKGWPTANAIKELQDLVIEHDLLVEKACHATVRRRVFRVAKLAVEVAAEFGAEALRLPGLGAGAGLAIEVVQARFPSLEPEGIDPSPQSRRGAQRCDQRHVS